MNRVEFMRQLESLLRSIAPMEREEALQYYNDYFDDAGKENEQEVIEALGNPARVAENIKRDLLGSGYGEGTVRKALASDRALVEYGKEVQDGTSEETVAESPEARKTSDDGAYDGVNVDSSVSQDMTFGGGAAQESGSGTAGSAAIGEDAGGSVLQGSRAFGAELFGQKTYESGAAGAFGSNTPGSESASSVVSGSSENGVPPTGNQLNDNPSGAGAAYGTGGYGNTVYSQQSKASYTQERESEISKGKNHLPGWATALIIVCLIFTSPVLLGIGAGAIGLVLGLAGTAMGVIVAWLATIVCFGVAVIVMFVVAVVLVVIGFLCLFTNPWVGMAMIGSGLVCGGLGVLFLMLTAGMAGVVTPAIFRGIGRFFRFLFQKSEKGLQRG